MGCCISSANTTKSGSSHTKPPSRHHHSPPQPHKPHVTATRTPPLEEETVKEVLSETPIILKPQKTTTVAAGTTQTQEPKTVTQKNSKKHQEDQEISQASEICSNITDTLSTVTTTTATTTTTTITEIREDEVTSRKRVIKSPTKVPRKRPYTGERERGKTTGQVNNTATGQRNAGSSGVRRDFGRSPATRTAGGVGRGRVGTSPGKVIGKTGGRSVGRKNKEESVNGGVLRQQQQGNESLENPLVSMECFIFL